MSDALDQFLKDLGIASDVYRTDVRNGSAVAVEATAAYVESLVAAGDADPKVLVPLRGLVGAFIDASKGIANPHLRRDKYAGGPTTASEDVLTWANAAAIVDLFILAGDSEAEALRRVAIKRPAFDAKKLRNYRKQLTRSGSTTPTAGRAMYDQVRRLWLDADLRPIDRAHGALQTFQNMTEISVINTGT